MAGEEGSIQSSFVFFLLILVDLDQVECLKYCLLTKKISLCRGRVTDVSLVSLRDVTGAGDAVVHQRKPGEERPADKGHGTNTHQSDVDSQTHLIH